MTLTTEQLEAYTAERDRLTKEIAGVDAAMAHRERSIAVVEQIREQLAAKFARRRDRRVAAGLVPGTAGSESPARTTVLSIQFGRAARLERPKVAKRSID